MCFFKKYHESLYKCFKPYQYVGGEYLSHNKDFDSAKLRFALAFPDKYEIGISNLGVRILYELINKNPEFMCDRVYAPEPDFKPATLYGVESKRALKEFDAIGFSIQYEMSYPTILKMLEMSGIPYRNEDRTDDDPIIMAGGPCTFNPLPMSEFIDVFMIGDGEDSILEACKILEETKGMPRAERIKALCEGENSGRWGLKMMSTPDMRTEISDFKKRVNISTKNNYPKVKKRIAQLSPETAAVSYPIPFSSSLQDRAVVEIRRGCGRMCRFCQPGHVTLPIRERSAEEIIDLTKKLVNTTGYDEYSLLSLSSNDYANINEVIKELAVDFNDRKISVSLPSQRIDGFNLELANLVQSVRKSTMTLAPEAGSQRLRDVIKKNITEEQILNAVLTLYENGWSRVKFYFICGLPTETIEDMDEMAELFRKIRWRSKLLKKEKGLKHSLDLTCTLSIFVPKPFTPFQWCPQMDLEKVTEHIHHLMDRVKHIKGVKVNYHEKFVSLLEAVLTRGDRNLAKYIEALYKKGCYLDAWGEHFDKEVWFDTAKELGLDLNKLAQTQYNLDEPLPWDFVDVGIDKDWFKAEYIKAHETDMNSAHIVPTCQQKCVNCGVCKNLGVKKIMAPQYKASSKAQEITTKEHVNPSLCPKNVKESFRYRIKLTKTGILKYFSHLDWQNTFFKSISRSNLKVAFSYGYNPTMKISMGVALPLFCESKTELVDVELWEDVDENYVKEELSKVLPKESEIIAVKKIDRSAPSIDQSACWAEYKVKIFNPGIYEFEDFVYNTEKVLSSDKIVIEKKNKKGLVKKADIKRSIGSHRFENDCLYIVLKTGQNSDIPALRADVLMNVIAPNVVFEVTREKFLTESLHEL
ncbi:MAG: TIGR03960 family B12-binding radical SAM protein [Muribaculaceae bacterium]|nr:TIGR03960 family B12-binding radical SAM protein [Muribaculaceae bacterium]